VSDIEYLSEKEFNNKLFTEISAEFTTTGIKITRTIPNLKTFYIVGAKLYPVVATIEFSGSASTVLNKRADVEIKLDGTVIDVLTYDFESRTNAAGGGNVTGAAGANATQFDNLIKGKSLDGDGSTKKLELDATVVSGTYRVAVIGFEETTGESPRLP